MKIVKMQKLPGGLIEVEFDTGARAQYREEDLAREKDAKPEDFTAQIREIYRKDTGAGADGSAGKEKA
jgi:hypothetical protein